MLFVELFCIIFSLSLSLSFFFILHPVGLDCTFSLCRFCSSRSKNSAKTHDKLILCIFVLWKMLHQTFTLSVESFHWRMNFYAICKCKVVVTNKRNKMQVHQTSFWFEWRRKNNINPHIHAHTHTHHSIDSYIMIEFIVWKFKKIYL